MADSGIGSFVIPPPPGVRQHNQLQPVIEQGTVKAQIENEVYERAYRPVEGVKVFQCTCQRCPKVWYTLMQHRPKTCAGCHSAWWDRPRTPNSKKVEGVAKEPKRKKSVKGGKVGRPRKYALPEVGAGGSIGSDVVREEEIPEIPVGLLGTVGGFADLPGGGGGGGAEGGDKEAFPVEAPDGIGVDVAVGGGDEGDSVLEVGQSVDGGDGAGGVAEGYGSVEPDDWWLNNGLMGQKIAE
jgi:hypothetical protein